MPASLPYLTSNKNLSVLFEKIASAKVPETFNREFLQTTIGLKGSNDRALIPLLRTLGFVDQSNQPTSTYRLLKGDRRRAAIAAGIRKAYEALFDADQDGHNLSGEKLRSVVAQVAGTDDDLTGRIASTFSALTKLADFNDLGSANLVNEPEGGVEDEDESSKKGGGDFVRTKGLRTEFHYNIQVHLPSNGAEDTYINIFNAIRKVFQ